MLKLAIFDLDGTLAPIGAPISEESLRLLKRIEDNGVRIVISSGKPVYYQIGMFRQVGLKAPIFIGENGSVIAFGVDLPPRVLYVVNRNDNFFEEKSKILRDVLQLCGDGLWLQPNEVMLTLFFKDEATHNRLHTYFAENKYKHSIVYEHSDSFDIIPNGLDKKCGLECLGRDLGISKNEMIAVGDGINDIPMFEYCKYSVGVAGLDSSITTYHFDDISKALKLIGDMAQNDKQI